LTFLQNGSNKIKELELEILLVSADRAGSPTRYAILDDRLFLLGGEAMEKAKCWIVLICMVLALVNLDSLVFAQDKEAETLRGLQGVKVTIIIGSKLLEEMQIENQLHLDAELKLRMAGIKVVSFDEVSKLPGRLACFRMLD